MHRIHYVFVPIYYLSEQDYPLFAHYVLLVVTFSIPNQIVFQLPAIIYCKEIVNKKPLWHFLLESSGRFLFVVLHNCHL